MVLFGVALMVYQNNGREAVPVSSAMTDEQFLGDTENRIEQMLKNVDGAGDCKVTITLASGSKKEYVREAGNVLVITDNQGNQSAVVAKEVSPEIAGVTVLSVGAKNIEVQKDIIQSVSTLLGIGSNKVCVILLDEE